MGKNYRRRGPVSLAKGVRSSSRRSSYLEPRRCVVEPLEDRCLLAADTGLDFAMDTVIVDSLDQPFSADHFVALPIQLANARDVELAMERASNLGQYSQQTLDQATDWIVYTSGAVTQPALAALMAPSTIPNTFIVDAGGESSQDMIDLFEGDAAVDYFYPLVPVEYVSYAVTDGLPNDPYVEHQWHLQNVGQQVNPSNPFPLFASWGEDLNVVPAWASGATGEGAVIAIVDDGLQYTHPDIAPNYDPSLSWDFVGVDPDPMAIPFSGNFHGTSVAGVAAGAGDNGLGIAGVAYDATLAGVRFLGRNYTDLEFYDILTYKNQEIDIYNNSWGLAVVRTLAGPGPFETQALIDSVSFGRGGLGNIHVFATGNDAGSSDTSNYNGHANNRYTIAVGSFALDGTASEYSEAGTSLMVVAPSSGHGGGILTTDLMGEDGYNETGFLEDQSGWQRDYFEDIDYTSTFGGTSSAAPVVSGVIAQMLGVNPNLTYRDVEHILARSARQISPDDYAWIQNHDPLFFDPWTDDAGLPFDPASREQYALPDGSFAGSALLPIPADGPPFTDQHAPVDLVMTNGAGFLTHYEHYSTHPYGYGHGAIDSALAVELARNWYTGFSALPERDYST